VGPRELFDAFGIIGLGFLFAFFVWEVRFSAHLWLRITPVHVFFATT
jgi:hypothetical protein